MNIMTTHLISVTECSVQNLYILQISYQVSTIQVTHLKMIKIH